jgi:hypothetical protein
VPIDEFLSQPNPYANDTNGSIYLPLTDEIVSLVMGIPTAPPVSEPYPASKLACLKQDGWISWRLKLRPPGRRDGTHKRLKGSGKRPFPWPPKQKRNVWPIALQLLVSMLQRKNALPWTQQRLLRRRG